MVDHKVASLYLFVCFFFPLPPVCMCTKLHEDAVQKLKKKTKQKSQDRLLPQDTFSLEDADCPQRCNYRGGAQDPGAEKERTQVCVLLFLGMSCWVQDCSESAPIWGSDFQTMMLFFFVVISKERVNFNASPINSPRHLWVTTGFLPLMRRYTERYKEYERLAARNWT